jgi:hypothetical protein
MHAKSNKAPESGAMPMSGFGTPRFQGIPECQSLAGGLRTSI